MKILLIITDYGSFNNFLSEVAVQLLNSGHEVHVICSLIKVINCKDKYPYKEMGVVFHYLDFPRSFNPISQIVASRKINKKIDELSPDLINIHFTTGIITTLIWRKPRFFTIGTMHGVGYPVIKTKIKHAIFKAIEKYCFKKLDQIYLINEFDYKLVKELYPQKTFYYNSYGVGCDVKKFDTFLISKHLKDNIKRDLLISDDDFVVAFTGRFVEFKGFDLVIKAFNSLIYSYNISNLKLLIIGGEDPIHPTGLSQQDHNRYKNNEHIIRIDFTGDVQQYLAVTDLFVFPSKKEGMPVCIMEALAMGVPVITSNTRGCNDLVQHNFNGLVLSDDPTVSEVREAILKLYRDREFLHQLSKNALMKRTDFSRQNYVKDQIEIYKKVLSPGNNYKYA